MQTSQAVQGCDNGADPVDEMRVHYADNDTEKTNHSVACKTKKTPFLPCCSSCEQRRKEFELMRVLCVVILLRIRTFVWRRVLAFSSSQNLYDEIVAVLHHAGLRLLAPRCLTSDRPAISRDPAKIEIRTPQRREELRIGPSKTPQLKAGANRALCLH